MSGPGGGREAGGRPLTGRTVLLIAVGAFAVVVAVNVYMMTRAVGGFPGLVVENSYQAGQGFDARKSAQEALGWSMAARYEAGGVTVEMTGPDGAPLEGLTLDAVVGRPATAVEDRPVALLPAANGYRAEAALEPGVWLLSLRASNAAGDRYEARTEFVVRPGEMAAEAPGG